MAQFSDAQKAFMQDLFSSLDLKIEKNFTLLKEEVREEIKGLKQEIETVVETYENKIKKLESENNTLKSNLILLERKVRKNNIIIYGTKSTDTQDNILNIFKEALQIEITDKDISDYYHLGDKNNTKTPILIELVSYKHKQKIIKNAYKLKDKGIRVTEDLCTEDRTTRNILLKHRREAREKGIIARIKGDRLLIGTDVYTVEQLEIQDRRTPEKENYTKLDKPTGAQSTPNLRHPQKRSLEEQKFEEELREQDIKKLKTNHRELRSSSK